MKLFLLAGESSGDLLGADLVKRMSAHISLRLSGVGGVHLQNAGLSSLFPMSDLAVMGWRDVYMRLPQLFWRLNQTVDHILASRPDLIVLIDSQEFSVRVAARVRKAWPQAKIFLYVAPSVWAWRPERARKIKPLYDEIFAVLPFEPRIFRQLDGPVCTYVGHMAERLASMRTCDDRSADQDCFLFLPGSRAGEIHRNLPQFAPSIVWLNEHEEALQLLLPTLSGFERKIRQQVSADRARIVTGRTRFIDALKSAQGAVAVSGTVTLELGCARVPHITTYRAEPAMMRHYLKSGRPSVNLNNIIAGRAFVPEVVGTRDLAVAILREVQHLTSSDQARAEQLAGFEEVRHKIKEGEPEAPRRDIVERLLVHLD